MIENKNKKRVNRGEFLQGGEPPLIGRARSSQKTSLLFIFAFSNRSCPFFSPPSPCIFFLFLIIAVFFSLTPMYIFF